MFGKIGEMGNLLKQAGELKGKMATIQRELGELEISGSSGGKAVEVSMDGNMRVKRVRINPECLKPEDAEMVEDMVLTAFNAALEQAQKAYQAKMLTLTGGLKIPGLFGN